MAKRSKESEDNECSRGLVTMEDSHLNAELRMKAMVLISRNRFVAILVGGFGLKRFQVTFQGTPWIWTYVIGVVGCSLFKTNQDSRNSLC